MNWIELAKERPPITRMGQTDIMLIIYLLPEGVRQRTVAFYDQHGKGTGWRQAYTFHELPEPTHWMPFPPLP